MNGHWRLRDGSDVFPTSKFTRSLILNQRPSISTTHTIESFSKVLNSGKDDSFRIIRSNNSNNNSNNSNEKDRHVIMEYELKTLQYERSKKGDIIFSLLESDNKFQQLCFYSFGPDPYERCVETFKLDLTGYEIKVKTRCYRYDQVYTQIRYLVRESAIIANILKNRLNSLRIVDRPTTTVNSATLHSKCSLTENQFLAITSSYSLVNNNGDYNDDDNDDETNNNNHNSSGDIYTHIYNVTQPNSYNNGLSLLASTNNASAQLQPLLSSYANPNTANGGAVGIGVDVAKLSLRIVYTGLIQDVFSTKFKLNISTAVPPPTTIENKKVNNNDHTINSGVSIHSNAGNTTKTTAKTEEDIMQQVKESVSKFLLSHPCDKSVRIYVTQVSYESLTWYTCHRYNQYYMLNKFIMSHIQDDKAHLLQKQQESESNFQSLLQLQSSSSSSAQVNTAYQQHQQQQHAPRPSILQTNQSIRSISSQQQQQQQQPSTTTAALEFYRYNSKKDDDDDDAYSTVTGNDNDAHHNSFFSFPPKRYFNVYGNEDVAYYQQRKEQLQVYINHLVHKMQIKHSRNNNTAVDHQQIQQQQHVSIEQVLLWFFEIPAHLQLQKNIYTDRLLTSQQSVVSSTISQDQSGESNNNQKSITTAVTTTTTTTTAVTTATISDTCLQVSIPLFIAISATQPNLNGFPSVIQYQIYHLLYQDKQSTSHSNTNNSTGNTNIAIDRNLSSRDLRLSAGSSNMVNNNTSSRNIVNTNNTSPPIGIKQQRSFKNNNNSTTTTTTTNASVSSQQQKFGGSSSSSGYLVVYIIEIVYGAVKWVICHRYHDFYLLYKYVKKELKSIIKHEKFLLKTLSKSTPTKTTTPNTTSSTTTTTSTTANATNVVIITYDQYIQYKKQFPKFPGNKNNLFLSLLSSKTQKYENRRVKFQEMLQYIIQNKSFYSLNIANAMYAFLSIKSHLMSPQLYASNFKQLIDKASVERVNTLDIFKQQQQQSSSQQQSQQEDDEIDRKSVSSRRISFLNVKGNNNGGNNKDIRVSSDSSKSNVTNRNSFANFIQSFSDKKLKIPKNTATGNINTSTGVKSQNSNSINIDNVSDSDDDDDDDDDDNSSDMNSNNNDYEYDDNSSVVSGCTNATQKSFINAKRLSSLASVKSVSFITNPTKNNNIMLSKNNKSNTKINKFLSIFKTENSNTSTTSTTNTTNETAASTTAVNTSSSTLPPPLTTAAVRLLAPVPTKSSNNSGTNISLRSSLFNFHRPPSSSPPIAEHDDSNEQDSNDYEQNCDNSKNNDSGSAYANSTKLNIDITNPYVTNATGMDTSKTTAVSSSSTSTTNTASTRTERAKRMSNMS